MSEVSLSVIVPIFNEEKTIKQVMDCIHAALPHAQVIYVDDGSTDSSLSIVRKHVSQGDSVLTKKNGGKGSAVLHGLSHAKGEYTIIQDADLEYDPADIPTLLQFAKEHNLDGLLGSRRLQKQEKCCDKWWYFLGGVCTTWMYNLLYRQRLTDMHSCYKMVRTELMKDLPLSEKGFGLDTEIVTMLAKAGIKLRDIGISYVPRSRKEGKKITWKDFFHCVYLIFLIRIFRPVSKVAH